MSTIDAPVLKQSFVPPILRSVDFLVVEILSLLALESAMVFTHQSIKTKFVVKIEIRVTGER